MALVFKRDGKPDLVFDDSVPQAKALEAMRKLAEPAMSFRQRELETLRRHEGAVTNKNGQHLSYLDSRGFLTGGIGHLMTDEDKVKYPVRSAIPEDVVTKWFEADTKTAEAGTNRLIAKRNLNDLPLEAKQVLFNMTYNLGEGGLDKFGRMWDALTRNDYKAAAQQMRNSLWYKQVKTRGEELAARMESLADPKANVPGDRIALDETDETNELKQKGSEVL